VNLAQFKFTNTADRAASNSGWAVIKGVVVDALAGNDTIAGAGGGIEILGTLNTGDGNDTIKASTTDFTGLDIYGKINTGNGNDTITGIGFCRDGDCGAGIDNRVLINTGAGDDTITGSSMANSGKINTGTGNDVVDFLKGGFRGPGDADFDGPIGKTFLGEGQDILKGFGSGIFYGGTGKDKMLFGKGVYVFSNSTIVSGGVTMKANDFEQVGGTKGELFAFKNGTLTVGSKGVGTFD
jgi:hypothetical protein